MPWLSPGRASRETAGKGVTFAMARACSDAPRAPVIMPAGSMPKPPGSGVTSPARRNRTRPIARLSPVDDPSMSEIRCGPVTERGTDVKGKCHGSSDPARVNAHCSVLVTAGLDPAVYGEETARNFADRLSSVRLHDYAHIVMEAKSRRFQPRHLGVELESKLGGFLLGQPAGHVRKDRPVKQDLVRIPRKFFRRAGFGQNLVQPGADLIRIGPIGRRGRVGFEQFGLRVGLEQVLLG